MISIQNILLSSYEEIKKQNPSYSLRAFSKKLGISSGALTCILKGRRKVSKKMGIRLAANLNLTGETRDEFFSTFSNKLNPNSQNCELEYVKLQMEHHAVISEWYHFGILSLMELDDYKSEVSWMAERLNVNVNKIEQAIERMLKLGMIKEENEKLVRSNPNFETTDEVKSLSVRKAHKSNLDLAANSIDEVPLELRDLTAITMAIDISKIKLAKEKIRKFHDEIANLLEAGDKKEVYKMCVQLFPLTNVKDQVIKEY